MRDLKYMESGVCALCGKDVRLDEAEGRVVCEGCDRATDNCTCVSDNLDTRHESPSMGGAMRKGTSAAWIADQPGDPDAYATDPDGYATDPAEE